MSVETVSVDLSWLKDALEIKKIGDLRYEGLVPLQKPKASARGVYGGFLCAQALLVAMETVPEGFTPHSMHSYFVKAGDDTLVCQYEVERINDGKNFANRLVRVSQKGTLKYMVMISLTRKNSRDAAAKEHEAGNGAPYPLDFQGPPSKDFHEHKPENLVVSPHLNGALQHFIPPSFHNPDPNELSKSPAERDLSFWIRLNDLPQNTKLKYAGFGVISDSFFLNTLGRILHFPNPAEGLTSVQYFSVSLDHSIYFHDDSFDPTKWMFCRYNSPRFSNNRVLMQGSYYTEEGKLVASMVQEGLVFFRDNIHLKAKL
ncbi:uncharacterized protein PRCAT00004750001 [Priceomyces carsonii]|uniref:uncharacterized protein n=1 Tax=Priceomyces carsonii TaxID=28549 RepID=UPI002EDB6B36|nr:unnamed protein product [Priceomyces carsonii]